MNEDETVYDLGVDINSNFTFHDGDIVLAEYDENIVQAVVNKLQTDLGELDLFYEDYGSIMMSFMGWRANEETLGFMKAELNNILQSEERLETWNFDINYMGDGKVRIDLTLYPSPDYSIDVTLQMSTEGITVMEA